MDIKVKMASFQIIQNVPTVKYTLGYVVYLVA